MNSFPQPPRQLVCSAVLSRSVVTPWTVAHQVPPSMGILQARILEWVAMPSSRGSSQPRDRTQISRIEADSLLSEPPGSVIPANSEMDFQRVPLVWHHSNFSARAVPLQQGPDLGPQLG